MRRIALLLVFSLLTFGTRAYAQSMTDNQLVQYILQEKEKGTDQQVIIRNLVQRGVTVEQLRRVRKKVEAEQKQLGATDLTGKNEKKTDSRLRTRREVDRDERQKQQGFMVRSKREEDEWRYKDRTKQMEEIEEESDYFDLDSLDYYAQQVPKDQQVFGRNIFNQKYLSFEPNMNMATPANYRLGAGDAIIIDVCIPGDLRRNHLSRRHHHH